MELRTYVAIIWRRKWIILMGSAILILLTLFGLNMVHDKYTATARLRFLTPKSGGTSYIDFNIYYATRVMNTYSSLASSSSMAQEIKDKLKLPKPPKIEASVIADSELINITSEEKDPNLSATIANTAAEILVDRSKMAATDSQSSAEKAINAQLDQLSKELSIARDVYKRLNIPHNQNNYRITELNSEIQNDQQLYISLKNVYEQNVQLVRKDETAISELNTQIADLEKKITTNKATVDQLNQLAIQDSAQLESARDEITLKDQEYSNLVTQLDQIQTLVIIQGSNQLALEEKAIPSMKPSSPNRLLITLIGILFSIFISIIAGFIVDNLDDSFQNNQQIETTIDGKFIGDIYFAGNRIQRIFNRIKNKQVIETNHTYLNLHRQIQKQKLKTIGLCGVVPGTSNSALATRVSIEYANSGMKVLLMDASMLASDLYHYFPSLKAKAGLSEYLSSELSVDEIINPTDIENLSIIPPGSKTPANGLLLSSKKMLVLLKTLKIDYDLIFVEISPFSTEGDVDDLICHVDGIVEVIHQGRSKMKNVLFVASHLVELNAPLVGYIITHS
jgi:capsular exopolysaccharide synthesis family protein